MTDQDIRQIIADALDYAAVFRFRRGGGDQGFMAGDSDITFEELELDSLSAMELCIAIELETGVSILPGDLPAIGSLAALVKSVAEGMECSTTTTP